MRTFTALVTILLVYGLSGASADQGSDQIAEVGDAEPRLTRLDTRRESPISVVRPATKYESKAHDAGSAVTELLWERTRP